MTTISAQTILRSRNTTRPDKVLTTLLLRYPRWIHAEFMTHRVFSRNAASSRAIPVEKLIRDVMDNPAMPIVWGKNQKGMQASEECNAPVALGEEIAVTGIGEYPVPKTLTREEAWLEARDRAIEVARAFAAAGYHKQVVNRLLEPFAHITVVVSSTEWDNFLELRDHPDAEPHIQMLAREIRRCLEDESKIQTLHPGEWHLPFITPEELEKYETDDLIKLSVARCASTSYKTVDGFDMTLERAIALHDKLVSAKPIHASPAEHVAQADNWVDGHEGPYGEWRVCRWANPHQHGNFVGFRQYRHMLQAGRSVAGESYNTMTDRHWNYRIVRRYNKRNGQPWLEITEVHYRNGKPVAFADRLLAPAEMIEEGGTEEEIVDELRATLEKMMEATKKPILDERTDFESAP